MGAKSLALQPIKTAPPAIAERCSQQFVQRFGTLPTTRAWAPGRINLVGGHTDVNGGLALPVAINRWVCVCLRPRLDDRFIIEAHDLSERFEGNLSELQDEQSGWRQQITGLLSLVDEFEGLPSGFEAVFLGDIPIGAGLSSSAALSVAWLTALRSWTGANLDRHLLARLAQQVERDFLGLPCGLLDPVASIFSEPNCVLQVDFRDLSIHPIEADFKGLSWVILHTGVSRELAHSGYADRVRDCAHGLVALHRGYPVRHFRDIRIDMLDMDTTWARRLRHVVHENDRVQQAADLLKAGQAHMLGPILLASHESLRDDYEVSCPELNRMVELGMSHPAGLGGRMMGGGFGGCVLHLVRSEEVEGFMADVLSDYQAEFKHSSRAFCLEPVAGASWD
jgi:galactokinase